MDGVLDGREVGKGVGAVVGKGGRVGTLVGRGVLVGGGSPRPGFVSAGRGRAFSSKKKIPAKIAGTGIRNPDFTYFMAAFPFHLNGQANALIPGVAGAGLGRKSPFSFTAVLVYI